MGMEEAREYTIEDLDSTSLQRVFRCGMSISMPVAETCSTDIGRPSASELWRFFFFTTLLHQDGHDAVVP